MFWTDNMCIPLNAANPLDAMTYMDYVYDPQVQAEIEDYNNYVCPVPAAQDDHPERAEGPGGGQQPHGVPDRRDDRRCPSTYYQYKNQAELNAWNNLFVPITQ